MELKDQVADLRKRMENLRKERDANGVTDRINEEYEWLKTEVQLVQAEALTRLAYKSW